MEIVLKVIGLILSGALVYIFYCFYKVFYCFYKSSLKIERIIESLTNSIELFVTSNRNKEVSDYRLKLFKRLNRSDFNKLATHKEMFESNKPLEDKYWVDVA